MITIANPIYDAVFKYLMEDSRVARTILSALLKREVVELEMRKHEYANNNRDKKIEAQNAQIEAKDAALLASAKALKEAGLSDEQIKALTGVSL